MLVDHHHHHRANTAHNSVLLMKREEQQQQNGFGSSSSSNSPLLMPPWLAGPNQAPSHFDHHHQISNSGNNQHIFSGLQDFSTDERDFSPNPNPNPNAGSAAGARLPPFQPPVMSAHMSATALLQKAAQIGATMSSDEPSSISSPAPRGDGINDRVGFSAKTHREISAGVSTGNNSGGDHNHHQAGLTRDFLGLRALSHSDILSLAGLGNTINISHHEHQNNQQTLHKPW